jgi:hypothetical protein
MHTLLRLPLILLELALRGGAGALKDILRLVSGGSAEAERPYVPSREAEAEAAAGASARRKAERVAAAEASARRPAARPSAARRRTRPAAPRPVEPVPEPPAPAPAHVSSEPEPVASFGPADAPGATLEVDPPWEGYDQHSAAEVVKRVRTGDDATRAVVLLYERSHKARKSIIAAAEASPS